MNGTHKQIFIVITQTGTMLSRILKRITGAEYNTPPSACPRI